MDHDQRMMLILGLDPTFSTRFRMALSLLSLQDMNVYHEQKLESAWLADSREGLCEYTLGGVFSKCILDDLVSCNVLSTIP